MQLALCHCLLLGEAGSEAEVMDLGEAERKRHTASPMCLGKAHRIILNMSLF